MPIAADIIEDDQKKSREAIYYEACTPAPAAWIALMKDDREKMIRLIRETVQSGGSVFVGEKSLLGQFV